MLYEVITPGEKTSRGNQLKGVTRGEKCRPKTCLPTLHLGIALTNPAVEMGAGKLQGQLGQRNNFV